jgi:Skp family chaperone for outer membrane proteins
MRGFGLVLTFFLVLSGAFPAPAQPADPLAAGLAVLDERRLFNESRFGQRVLLETQASIDALIAENKLIEAELENEERALAEQRDSLDPQAFRELADAFDQRATQLRRERAEREQTITARVQEEERRFQAIANAILGELGQELGLVAILSLQSLIYHRPEIDVTQRLIDMIDARHADGSE